MNFHLLLRGFWLLLFFAPALRAQTTTTFPAADDTVRIMVYNLLNYGNGANPPHYKNARLSTIVQHVQPDVIGVNEVFSQPALLDSILLALGSGWSHGDYSNAGSETQTNSLFFRSGVFNLRSQRVISSVLRDIIAYRLQYRDSLTVPHDTVFLTAVVCHLKASPGSSEEAARAAEAATIAQYLDSLGAGNYVVMGDMNVFSSNEAAYQMFIADPNPTVRLYDPIARPGSWSGNASFADVHTQSPRTVTTLGDGGANGGLDDRFDQILVSGPVMQSGAAVQYLAGSYKTVGQDGLHYNRSLLDTPGNAAAPAAVVQALYEMSDHLPVRADFVLRAGTAAAGVKNTNVSIHTPDLRIANPLSDWLDVALGAGFNGGPVSLALYSMQGVEVLRLRVESGSSAIYHFIGSEVPAGLYALVVQGADGLRAVRKVVKQ